MTLVETKEKRKEIFQTIYGVEKFTQILTLFEEEYNSAKDIGITEILQLYKKYSYAIFFMYSPSSIRTNLVKFKNIIKKNGGIYKVNALDIFTIDEVYSPIRADDLARKEELKKELDALDPTTINPQIIIDKIKELKSILDNNEFEIKQRQTKEIVRAYYIVTILGLATGRRFAELLKTLKIEKVKNKIYFRGLVKGNEDIEANIIYLSYEDTIKYLKELREIIDTKNMTTSELNLKYSKKFNLAIKRIGFENIKVTRQNYSIAGSQLFKRENENIQETITRILGHKEVFISALNYSSLK